MYHRTGGRLQRVQWSGVCTIGRMGGFREYSGVECVPYDWWAASESTVEWSVYHRTGGRLQRVQWSGVCTIGLVGGFREYSGVECVP